ncbi:complement receptor type 2-like [Bolinopsis microptera]|uniref:complement receptor type 2-like n=1 Tax=Bolinopsis microptera TaxID=2820187 RepID=UPI003079A025
MVTAPDIHCNTHYCRMRALLWLLLLIYIVESTDYRKCHHIRKRKELRCHGNNLGAVPANIPADLVKLEIKNDDLSSGFEFPELTRLRKLWLTNVNIGKEFPKLAFAKLKLLQDLRITYLPSARKNYTVTIHPEAFHMMKKLSTVRLMNLGIPELPEYMFRDSKQLRHIYVNGMPIETIRSNTFAPLERVQQLNLMHNKISTIEEGTFDCMDATYRDSRIYLSNNRLRTIPEVDSISRTQIMIQDNPIVCDCTLVIPSNFNDRKAVCEEPSSLKETFILDLKGKAIQCVCHGPDIVHGEADHDSSLQPGEYLKISCHTGYSLQVLPSVQCQEDGTFGDTALPECIEDRVEPEELEDGSLLIISNAFSVYPNPITLRCPTDTVVKSCKCVEFYCQGVVLEDTSCRVYAAPGNATKGELICVPTGLLLEHYTYEYTENFEHYAKCKPYYQMTACTNYNPMTRVATDHGVLDQDMSGICRVDCGNIDCDLYIRCLIIIEKKKCDKFSIYMGSVTKEGVEMTASTKFEEGDVVTITCDEGYEFDLLDDVYLTSDETQATLTCIEGEIYEPPEIPMCFEIIPECELTRIENVVASPGWTVFEEHTITLTCGEGYEGEEVVVECQYGGVFQQPQIHCQERVTVQCPIRPIPHTVLTLPDSSVLEERSVLEGTILLVSCEEGYEISNNNNNNTNITCLATGKMSAEIPSCTEVIEPELETCVVPLIRHGGVNQHSPRDEIEPGTVLTVYCSEGYSLRDPSSNTLECITKQYYQPSRLPRCEKREVRCQVPQLFNGYYHPFQPGEEILKDDILYAVCNPDYILEGPDFLMCTDERFGGEVNRCEKEKIDCAIPFIANGEVMNSGKHFKEGDSYPIVCDRGYYNTYTYINCVVGPSTYDPYSVPDCLRPEYGCPKVGFPLMKPLLQEPDRGESVEVECIEGYTLVGDSTLTCGTKYDYTARKLPDCVPIAGCETPTIENGSVNSTLAHTEDGMGIELSCNPGYAMYGDPVITCEKGTWSGIITPECRAKEEMDDDCRIPFVNNGIFWPLSDSGIVNPGSTLLLLCNDGFGVENDFDRVMCVTTAIFDPPILPECVELEITGCPTPNIQHGQVDPDLDIEVGDTVYVTCDQGYELQGPEELECGADGSYDELPVCTETPTVCPAPEIDNAIISPNRPINEGESYIVVCNSGYERVGDEVLSCGTDGVTFGITNRAHPDCSKIPEPCEIPSIKNGWFVLPNQLGETETVIAYKEAGIVICNQPDYGPDQTRVTCIGNSRWSPAIPMCTWEGPTCEFPNVANGVVSPQMDIVMPWTTLTIECDEGFEKNPKVDLECINSGEVAYFNNKIPVCEQVKIKCNRPVIKHGYINGPDPLETDDRFTVECNEGYELVGPGDLWCATRTTSTQGTYLLAR